VADEHRLAVLVELVPRDGDVARLASDIEEAIGCASEVAVIHPDVVRVLIDLEGVVGAVGKRDVADDDILATIHLEAAVEEARAVEADEGLVGSHRDHVALEVDLAVDEDDGRVVLIQKRRELRQGGDGDRGAAAAADSGVEAHSGDVREADRALGAVGSVVRVGVAGGDAATAAAASVAGAARASSGGAAAAGSAAVTGRARHARASTAASARIGAARSGAAARGLSAARGAAATAHRGPADAGSTGTPCGKRAAHR
jgi:hypothetical protein